MNDSMWADAAPEPQKPTSLQPTTSNLSADAVAFAPDTTSGPPNDVSSLDMYAATGAQQSDLFDDVVPIESMRIRSDDDLFADDFTPAAQPIVAQSSRHVRGSGESPRLRGRGRGRGGREAVEGRGNNERRGSPRIMRGSQSVQRGNDRAESQDLSQPGAPESAPEGPRKEMVASVRGDRRATGGIKKPKLTEEELAEKMAKVQIKNASLTAAHARAEADAASFAAREHQAEKVSEQRRKEERRDRQQMMGEREKNRLRKLKALGGREWDAEKRDEDFDKGGQFDRRGGFAGDKQDYSDGREYLLREPRGGDRGRGSGKGGRGGRHQQETALPKQEDFPALPDSTTKVHKSEESPSEDMETSDPGGRSWADQVEASKS